MGLIGKLKEILFDEETVEIPVITKEEREEAKKVKKNKKEVEPQVDVREKHPQEKDDEVIIRKIETPKRQTPVVENSEDLFDMPKLKEDAKEEKRVNTFTFPVFDDDEKPQEKRAAREKREEKVKENKSIKEAPREKRVSGYTNAYDYSYGKYKGDYKSSRESNQEYLSKTLEVKEEKKAFTPSPIISPVYGVLNENYKKEDIVTKTERKENNSGMLDLDSVRRKAYGTLEDEIAESLSYDREPEVKEETVKMEALDDDEGISIDDLLVDNGEKYEGTRAVVEEKNDDTELFNVLDEEEANEEIEIEDVEEEKVVNEEVDLEPSVPRIPDDGEEIKVEKTDDKHKDRREPVDEEDLFDLIDSLYDGKGEA